MKSVNKLTVTYHDRIVGTLSMTPDNRLCAFISASELTDMVTTKKGTSIYLIYNAELNVIPAFGELDFTPIAKSGDSYSPHLLPIKSLIKENIDA